MVIKGIEFDVKQLTRKQNRELRKKGFDIVEKMMGAISGEGLTQFPFTGEEIDLVLDICFGDREDDLDKIGLAGQVELAMAVISKTAGQEDETKN